MKIPYFLLFLIKKGYTTINSTDTLMEDVLNDYVDYYNIDYDYEGIYEYHQEDVTYDEMKDVVEKYFKKIIENNEGTKKCGNQKYIKRHNSKCF